MTILCLYMIISKQSYNFYLDQILEGNLRDLSNESNQLYDTEIYDNSYNFQNDESTNSANIGLSLYNLSEVPSFEHQLKANEIFSGYNNNIIQSNNVVDSFNDIEYNGTFDYMDFNRLEKECNQSQPNDRFSGYKKTPSRYNSVVMDSFEDIDCNNISDCLDFNGTEKSQSSSNFLGYKNGSTSNNNVIESYNGVSDYQDFNGLEKEHNKLQSKDDFLGYKNISTSNSYIDSSIDIDCYNISDYSNFNGLETEQNKLQSSDTLSYNHEETNKSTFINNYENLDINNSKEAVSLNSSNTAKKQLHSFENFSGHNNTAIYSKNFTHTSEKTASENLTRCIYLNNKETPDNTFKIKYLSPGMENELALINEFIEEKMEIDIVSESINSRYIIPINNLDLELVKNKGYTKIHFDSDKIFALLNKSLNTINLYEEFLEKDIKDSMMPATISKYFIYNYFFDDNLRVKYEYCILILILPEVNCITVLYGELQKKQFNYISTENLREYIKIIVKLIKAYKQALEKFIVNYKGRRKFSYDNITELFCRTLMNDINNFREINIKVLEELVEKNCEGALLIKSNTIVDDENNQVLKCDDFRVLQNHLQERYGKKLKSIFNLLYPNKPCSPGNLPTKKKGFRTNIKQNDDSSKNMIEPKNLTQYNKTLNSYTIFNNLISKSKIYTYFTKSNNLFLILFLNRDWLESISSDGTYLLPMDINIADPSFKKLSFNSQKKFSVLHHNINLFLKMIFNKYNYKMNEEIVDFDYKNCRITFCSNDKNDEHMLTCIKYIFYIYEKYSEYLLQFYLNSYS